MSLAGVSEKIQVLAKKPVVREADPDLDEVFVAAERSVKGRPDGVSNAEGRAIADFFLGSNAPLASLKVVLEDGAVSKFNAFFMAHNLPYGDNKLPMKERIQNALSQRTDLGEPMARPPRTGSLQPLRLTKADESTRKDAYVDVVKKQFFVKVMDGAAEAKFYGPFGFDGAAAT